jgi:hypothetical protein
LAVLREAFSSQQSHYCISLCIQAHAYAPFPICSFVKTRSLIKIESRRNKQF